ncbi:MAG: cupin fold metalloprotein, WbuC family [Rikenellaceae bacterium]|nr:cupin fold metalloprotein, WbuC family [Rikenellaceae bacterium]
MRMSVEPKVEFIDDHLMAEVASQAREAARLRINYNFHRTTDEPVNRLLNAMNRGSYLPVHRHLSPDRCESSIVLRGRVGLTIYDDSGRVVERRVVGSDSGCCGFDIEAGVWHGLVVLEDDTVLFEVKQGPYAPITPDNLAPWTPAVDDKLRVEAFIKELEQSFEQI